MPQLRRRSGRYAPIWARSALSVALPITSCTRSRPVAAGPPKKGPERRETGRRASAWRGQRRLRLPGDGDGGGWRPRAGKKGWTVPAGERCTRFRRAGLLRLRPPQCRRRALDRPTRPLRYAGDHAARPPTTGRGRQAPSLDALHPHGGLRHPGRASDRERGGPVGLGLVGQAVPGRVVGSVRGPGWTWAKKAGRGRCPPGRPTRLLPHMGVCPPGGHRVGRAPIRAGARGHQQGVLHHQRQRGGRVGVEAGPSVLQGHRPAAADQGHIEADLVPRHHHGGTFHNRLRGHQEALRTAGPRYFQGPQHGLLQGPGVRRRPRSVRSVGRRPDSRTHRSRGARNGGGRFPRTRPERRRLPRPPSWLLRSCPPNSATATGYCWSPTRSYVPSGGSATGSGPSAMATSPT